jgi:hypothetical protein
MELSSQKQQTEQMGTWIRENREVETTAEKCSIPWREKIGIL